MDSKKDEFGSTPTEVMRSGSWVRVESQTALPPPSSTEEEIAQICGRIRKVLEQMPPLLQDVFAHAVEEIVAKLERMVEVMAVVERGLEVFSGLNVLSRKEAAASLIQAMEGIDGLLTRLCPLGVGGGVVRELCSSLGQTREEMNSFLQGLGKE